MSMGINGFRGTGYWAEHSVQKLLHRLLMLGDVGYGMWKVQKSKLRAVQGLHVYKGFSIKNSIRHRKSTCIAVVTVNKTDFELNLSIVLKSFAYGAI